MDLKMFKLYLFTDILTQLLCRPKRNGKRFKNFLTYTQDHDGNFVSWTHLDTFTFTFPSWIKGYKLQRKTSTNLNFKLWLHWKYTNPSCPSLVPSSPLKCSSDPTWSCIQPCRFQLFGCKTHQRSSRFHFPLLFSAQWTCWYFHYVLNSPLCHVPLVSD